MNGDLIAAFENKTAFEILQELGRRIYRPPLSPLRDRLREMPAAFRVPMLVIDFDTEVHMQGIYGFLENSTGRYLDETIDALEAIGAQETPATMKRIRAILAPHLDPAKRAVGNTHIAALWAEGGEVIGDAIEAQARRLYVYLPPQEREDIFAMLELFIEKNRAALLRVIRDCSGTT
jgi:hypothetical protein